MLDYQQQFIDYALQTGVLKFGEFQLKSGRISPYFFNTGLFNSGQQLATLGRFYAQALQHSGLEVDMLYGPAYKGIPLAVSTAMAYAELQRDIPFAFNRKEAKNHGEGGLIVGSAVQGRVLIVDDVITAGTSVRESVEIIRSEGAQVAGVLIALDRQERGLNALSAVQEVAEQFGIAVIAIIKFNDVVDFIEQNKTYASHLDKILSYRQQYGV